MDSLDFGDGKIMVLYKDQQKNKLNTLSFAVFEKKSDKFQLAKTIRVYSSENEIKNGKL